MSYFTTITVITMWMITWMMSLHNIITEKKVKTCNFLPDILSATPRERELSADFGKTFKVTVMDFFIMRIPPKNGKTAYGLY